MKKIRNFALLPVLVFTVVMINWAWSRSSESAEKKSQISKHAVPELLKRNAAIGNGEEVEFVLTAYDNSIDALQNDPTNTDAYLRLAELFILEARATGEHGHYYPAALKMVETVLNAETKDDDAAFRALSLKASVLLSLHRFSDGLETAEEAVKLNPYNAQIYGALVDGNVELGNYEEAVKAADKMISIRPDLRSYSRVSYLREIHGDVEGAIEALEMAVSSGYPGYEDKAWARTTLGKLYETYGNLKKAEEQYLITLTERQDYPFAIAGLASIKMAQKDYREAEKLLKQACEVIPEVSFFEQLADLYKETGREDEAHALCLEILEMYEEDKESGHNMNLDLAKFNLHAMADYDKSLELALEEQANRPDNVEVNEVLALIYLKKEDYQKASKYIEKAMLTNIKEPEVLSLAERIEAGNGQ
jgi:tetratricopeptide (TPR) repeat protein